MATKGAHPAFHKVMALPKTQSCLLDLFEQEN